MHAEVISVSFDPRNLFVILINTAQFEFLLKEVSEVQERERERVREGGRERGREGGSEGGRERIVRESTIYPIGIVIW